MVLRVLRKDKQVLQVDRRVLRVLAKLKYTYESVLFLLKLQAIDPQFY